MAATSAILRAFADLAAPTGQRSGLDVTAGRHPLVWVGLRTALVRFSNDRAGQGGDGTTEEVWASHDGVGTVVRGVSLKDGKIKVFGGVPTDAPTWHRHSSELQRLAAIDALHQHERLLREGWVYLVGTTVVDGERRRVCQPLLARPVVLQGRGVHTVVGAGDLEITPLISDPQMAAQLEADAQFGGGALEQVSRTPPDPRLLPRLDRLIDWVRRTAEVAGLPVDEVVDWTQPPARWRDAEGLVAVVGAGLHLSRDVDRPGLGDVLRAWAQVPYIDRTAFGALYTGAWPPASGAPGGDVRSPLPLSASQRDVVRRTRSEPLVVVSGAPGNGKSHLVAAIAIDAVARGDSVLIATPSRYAADVVGDLLYREPGPDPVLFGSTATHRTVAADLADGAAAVARAMVLAAAAADEQARRRVAELEEAISGLLRTEVLAGDITRWEPLLPGLTRLAPGVFAPDADLDGIAALVDAVEDDTGRWLAALRRRRAGRRLLMATGTADPFDLPGLRRAVAAARARRAMAQLAAVGGTRIGALWDELFAADAAAAEAFGVRLRAESSDARASDRARMAAVSGLSAALRVGRGRRRERLRELDGAALTAALPLWVGALTDIDDLLPPKPGLFDLVILDEASQIDQPRAAPALLRARRAVIVGDPRQLRHVSFVADAQQVRVVDAHGLQRHATQIDVRRMSAFDAAAAAAPVSFLEEHHRSVPHLIAFSNRRFYGGRIQLRTQRPDTETVDAIRVVHVKDATLDGGVNAAEVAAVAQELDRLADEEVTSIGVVSPFRAQADALESMLLERFDVEQITRLGLRAGTVHAFQGAERDVIVLSLGLTDSDAEQRRRFVEDPHLCNVMVTRARQRLVVVTSLHDAGEGILGDFLAHAHRPPARASLEPPDVPWVTALAAELERQAVTVRCGYRVGEDVIDLVVGDGAGARAVDCRVHPGGAAAHLAHRRALHRAGWRVTEAWASHYDHDAVRAAVELSTPHR